MGKGTDVFVVPPLPGGLTTDAMMLREQANAYLAKRPPVTPSQLITLVDHTTLKATDTAQIVHAHIDDALGSTVLPKAVCVTPDYAQLAVERLADFPIAVASVAGAFPHGRTLTRIRHQEIVAVLDAGVDELDIVLDRAEFLAGNHDTVFSDIAWVRDTVDSYTARDGKARQIKLIVETGELPTMDAIATAAWLALHAGADMVKTSTGTIPTGATPETVLLLAQVVDAFNREFAANRGVKVSGGVATVADALTYMTLAYAVFGAAACDPYRLRFGASKLLHALRNVRDA